MLTLEELDCANNPDLDSVPPAWRHDGQSVLFICRIHRDYYARMEELVVTNTDLNKHSQYLETEQLLMKEKLAESKYQIEELRKNLPKKVQQRMEKEARERAEEERDDGAEKKKGGCLIL